MKKYEVTLSFVVEVEAFDANHAHRLACAEVDEMMDNEPVYASDMGFSVQELETK